MCLESPVSVGYLQSVSVTQEVREEESEHCGGERKNVQSKETSWEIIER